MADEDDLKRLHNGEVDLAQSDFRDADLSGLDLSGRDFSGAHLEGAKAHRANFAGCDFSGSHWIGFDASGSDFSGAFSNNIISVNSNFSGCIFRGSKFNSAFFTRTIFSGVDFRGAVFAGAHFNEGTDLDGAVADDSSIFDDAVVFRPLSRSDVFFNYKLERGKLVRRVVISDYSLDLLGNSGAGSSENTSRSADKSESARRLIAARIDSSPKEIAELAGSLSLAIKEQMVDLASEKPNDPIHLDAYNRYITFLERVSAGLYAIENAISQGVVDEGSSDGISRFAKAAEIVSDLGAEVASWISDNRKTVVDVGFKTGLLGAGTAFLAFCGVPALLGFGAVAAVLSGKSVAEGAAAARDEK